jgi:ATP-dependent DNA helicase RecG
MRPAILHPLFAAVSTLAGVGPKLEKAFQRLVGRDPSSGARVVDLVFHLPVGVLDRRLRPKLADAPTNTLVTVEIIPERHRPAAKRGTPYRVFCRDETGDITLVFFAAQTQWIERALPVGERRWVSGRIETFDGMLQMVHPDRIVDAAGLNALAPIEPVYPMTEGLGARVLLKAMGEALSKVPALPEWQEGSWLASRGWSGFGESLAALHRPNAPSAIEPDAPARCRLAYDELLASQLALLMVRAQMKRLGGRSTVGDGRIAQRIEAALPFALTGSQTSALAEIRADMRAPTRMLRLLQGDVGKGRDR